MGETQAAQIRQLKQQVGQGGHLGERMKYESVSECGSHMPTQLGPPRVLPPAHS